MSDPVLVKALSALERSADEPQTFFQPFLELFPVTGAAVSTVGDVLGSETISASDTLAARIDELQFDLGEGPCWDAMSRNAPVLAPNFRTQPAGEWPAFTAALLEHPVNSLFAFPLVVGSLRIGAVDLYSVDVVDLTVLQSSQAVTMASAVGKHVLQRALKTIGGDYEDSGNARSRRVVHQATGMVIAQLLIPAEDARLVVQGHAFATGRSVMEIATDIVERRLSFSRGAQGIVVSE